MTFAAAALTVPIRTPRSLLAELDPLLAHPRESAKYSPSLSLSQLVKVRASWP